MDHTSATIRIGKEIFAAGLFWQPAPTAVLAAREARIVAAKAQLAADLFCVRKRGVPQFGLGQRGAGHKVGMRAVAPALALAIPESTWVGVFATAQGWLYVMVRKGAVMPDGDVLFQNEQEARLRLQSEMSIGDWDALFAPPQWQLDGSRADDLIDLISPLSDARLRSVARKSLGHIVTVGTVAVVGFGIWAVIFPRVPAGPSIPNIPVAPPPPAPPWQGQPTVRSLILACERAIEQTRQLPGFEIETVSCGPVGISTTYRRHWGSIAWLPKNSVVTSPDRATVTAQLSTTLVRRDGEEQPIAMDVLRRLIWGAAQTYMLDSEVNVQTHPGSVPFDSNSVRALRSERLRPYCRRT